MRLAQRKGGVSLLGTSTVVNLFQAPLGGIPRIGTGGLLLVFICFLVWLVRYFMAQIDKFTEERKSLQQQFDIALDLSACIAQADNHCTKVTETLIQQQHCFEMLMRKIDDLVAALNHK